MSNPDPSPNADPAGQRGPEIIIDKKPYRAPTDDMTGLELRQLARPPIAEDRDLWLEVPGGDDRLIDDRQAVRLKNGMHFYSTPKNITPGTGW